MNDTIVKMTENKQQYVYVMSNSSFPEDVLKIGWTREHPNIRAADLHTSGIPNPFIVEYVIITQEGSKLEKLIHERIKTYRINSNREFFKISKDELTKILVNELNLELTPITEILTQNNIKKSNNKKVNELTILYEELKKEKDEFYIKLNKEKSKLVIKEINKKKHVSICSTEYNTTPLEIEGFEDEDESRIKNAYYFINRDIEGSYKTWLDDLINNYEEIKERIGVKQIIGDNKSFKRMILETHEKLRNLKGKYIWDL